MTDRGYGRYVLHYIRTLDKREIDFIVAVDHQPILAVEVKLGDTGLSSPLKNRRKWFAQNPTLGIQVVKKRGVLQKYPDHCWVVSIEKFLSLLV
jgi:hypothetical protein